MGRRGQTAKAVRLDLLAMTSSSDDRTHLITAAAFDDGIWRGAGRYRAVCGTTVIAASMSSMPGPNCRNCYDDSRRAKPAKLGGMR